MTPAQVRFLYLPHMRRIMLIAKIIELTQLRNKLNKEKRAIDRKISIINNLINTSWYIENSRARQIRKGQKLMRHIPNE